jgi:MFS superfamily sulfate permease-like transporter
LLALGLAMVAYLLRPLGPLRWLPGWVVGGLLLWAVVELLRWAWWPRRWR